jgi:hypothetical protein
LTSGPISTGDPWLPDDATETVGNNVDAYADLGGEDGYTPDPNGPDYRAQLTGPHRFQYLWTDAVAAGTNTSSNKAAIVHLFFLNNWFHDWYYDSGFNEAAGNAQMDNFGRGAPVATRTRSSPRRSTSADVTTRTCGLLRTAPRRGCRCTCSTTRPSPCCT